MSRLQSTILSAVLLSLPLMTASAAGTSEEARLLRFPSTNSKEVVFSYAGDLYSVPITGGEARRLTSHKGYEMFARYSPDGSRIAFTGEYDGNREVYLMPSGGGQPVRLTWTATNSRDELGDRMGPNNIVMAWNPDGKSIVYRNRISDGFDGLLWSVSPDGGMPTRLPLPEGGFCSWSPDGSRLAYNRVMREFRTWKYYRGGMADDIWVWDGKKVTDITPGSDAQDIFPMWVGDEIYFASDRDMTMNIFVHDTRTGETRKVTDFTDYDVKFPSTDGRTIVYEQAGYIWKLDPRTKQSTRLEIRLASDDIYARPVRKSLDPYIDGASLSPDGRRIVMTARGEVFDVPAREGVTRNISRTPGAHERCAVWSPDSKSIAYISDLTGETEVYLQDALDETKAPVQLTRDNDTYIKSIRWRPDSRKILYTDRKNRVCEVDPSTCTRTILFESPEGGLGDVTYSADSKYLAYSRPAPNNMGVIYVRDLESGREYPVTEDWYNSGNPRFSEDGRYLLFSSDREFNPIYSHIEWNYAFTDMSAIYMALLSKDCPSPFLGKDDAAVVESDKSEKAASPATPMTIDPEGLPGRILRVPVKGSGWNMYSDGKKLWYASKGSTMVYDFSTGKDDKVCDGTLDISYGSKKAIHRTCRNEISVVDFPTTSVGKSAKVPTSDLIATVEYDKEWAQIFDEVWRAFRDGFYLENMHGRDWEAIRAKYEVLVPHARTRLDLNYIIGEMIGELACGHAYCNVGEYDKPERIKMGLLGAELSKDRSGFFRIDRILEGAPYSASLRSPLCEPGIGVREGDYITAVDGVSVRDIPNIYSLLSGKAGVSTELTVSDRPSAGGRKVVVKPIDDEYPLYHLAWVRGNIETVDKLSGGRIGYIYIPDMGPEGLREFARYYYPQLDKEALIIDDRANGGGNISPMIIERLLRKVYRQTMYRGTTMTGTIPEGTHTGPKVLLVNKYSASDGDLFPWSFKANNIGTVIGTRTWGGIIGISGSLPYMDGTDVRVPFFTNYSTATGGWIVENHGVDPDIVLDNDPVKEYAGVDQQLEEAVRVALGQLKDRVPLPGVPAPRTFRDLGLEQ